MEIKNLKKSINRIYITCLAFAVVAIALLTFLIFPLIAEIKNKSVELISAKNDVATLVAEDKEIESFKINYANYKLNFEKIDRMFVDEKNPVDFIKFLEQTASNSGITSDISLASSLSDNPTYLNFQFSSTGEYEKILKFGQQIESGPYLIEIENLVVSNSIDPQGSEKKIFKKVSATFLIKVFVKQ